MTKTTNFFVKISIKYHSNKSKKNNLWSLKVSSSKAPVSFIFSIAELIKVVGVSLPCFDNSHNLGQSH